ncbi:hypothetical protein PanWU01x14_313500 [Parasponia andersonii]|uniref:Uncharacterized protein n=1 Tax=Parasponia andersonii TaxID=3476 RepID=A0A2P5AP50_PARAD|nr:hypothetical protein PanWU01x14_313500 [Parasponia andersonii]
MSGEEKEGEMTMPGEQAVRVAVTKIRFAEIIRKSKKQLNDNVKALTTSSTGTAHEVDGLNKSR